MDREEEYTQELVIKIKGYGNKEHRQKQAANVKRVLEVSLQTEVEVRRIVGKKRKKRSAPIQRRDSNAYVSQGEPA